MVDIAPGPLRSRWTRAGGLALHSLACEDRSPAGAGPVVLVHGIGVSSRHMIPLAKELAPHFKVYAPDLPGFGRSADPDHFLGIAEFADVLAGWMEAERLPPAAWLGSSFGCQIIGELAVRHPRLISAAVLVSPTIDPRERSTPQQLRFLVGRAYGRSAAMEWAILRDYARAGMPRLAATLRMAIEDRPEERLAALRAPALVVRGAQDVLVSPEWARDVLRRLPDAGLAVIPGGRHALNFESPGELGRLTVSFLRRSGAAAQSGDGRPADRS